MDNHQLKTMFVEYFSNLENCSLDSYNQETPNRMFLLTHHVSNLRVFFRIEKNGFIGFWGDVFDRESFDLNNRNQFDFSQKFGNNRADESDVLKFFEAIQNDIFSSVQVMFFDEKFEPLFGTYFALEKPTFDFSVDLAFDLLQTKNGQGANLGDKEKTYFISVQNFDWSIHKTYRLKDNCLMELDI